MDHKKNIRRDMRTRRQQLSPYEQFQHADGLVQQLAQWSLFHEANTLAFYIANDGEIDPSPSMKLAWSLNKNCYLPLVQTDQTLTFAPYQDGDILIANQYGILEPVVEPTACIGITHLQLILIPLVAFDDRGNRIGMGKGYYDKTLASLALQSHSTKFIGLAHDFQRVDHLPCDQWDIPLHAVITERKIHQTA